VRVQRLAGYGDGLECMKTPRVFAASTVWQDMLVYASVLQSVFTWRLDNLMEIDEVQYHPAQPRPRLHRPAGNVDRHRAWTRLRV